FDACRHVDYKLDIIHCIRAYYFADILIGNSKYDLTY
ncbi:MAG: hypothetical protein RL041_1096, partial [Bacteroidota bacterium]